MEVSTAHPALIRRLRATFPLEGEGYYGGGLRYVVTFACFALIRRWRATFPTRGKATFGGSSLLGTAPIYKHH